MAEAAPSMAQAMAMYPMMTDAMAKLQAEGQEAVRHGARHGDEVPAAGARRSPQATSNRPKAQKKEEPTSDQRRRACWVASDGGWPERSLPKRRTTRTAAPGRATVLTTTAETLQVATAAADGDVALPAGFKLK